MAKRDYYEVLGVPKSASSEDIKSAYKRLAKQYHPDVSTDPKAKEKFQEVLEAYTILSDVQKRANFDQFGHATEGFQGYSGPQGFDGFGAGGIDFDFGDLFENLSGFGFGDFGFASPNQSRRKTGQNLRMDLAITFEEAVFGATKKIDIEHVENCSACKGTGAKGADVETCATCKGNGFVRSVRRMPFGVFSSQSVCGTCKGRGNTAKESCPQCRGTGHRAVKKSVEVKVPAGASPSRCLRLEGLGNAGENGGSAGDLFVVIMVEKHPFFKRDQADLLCEVPLSFGEAALGTKLEVPALKGTMTVTIPAGTQTGTVFRLKGKGVSDLQTGRTGDKFVKVNVVVPKKLSKEQKKLLSEWEKLEKKNRDPEGFWDRFGFKRSV
jgi:molecular chaperone DnaJ